MKHSDESDGRSLEAVNPGLRSPASPITPRRIYIIDDEPEVLSTLGRCLRSLDPSWWVSEFSTPTAVNAAARQNPPHLVLADQRMPEINGDELLDRIRQIAPGAVRILISVHVDFSRKLTAAHQYLCKPWNVRDLETRVRQGLAAQTALQNRQLAHLVSSLTSFPVLPSAYSRLIQELENDDLNLDRIGELLEQDGVLSRVIQPAKHDNARQTHINVGLACVYHAYRKRNPMLWPRI